MLRSTLSRETQDRGPRAVYPAETLRTAVDIWAFIPLFVRFGHRNMHNQGWPHVKARFPPVQPTCEFPATGLEPFLADITCAQRGIHMGGGYWLYKPPTTLTNIFWGHMQVLEGFRCFKAPSRTKPKSAGPARSTRPKLSGWRLTYGLLYLLLLG
jgi:hypothetical protein